MKMNFFPSWSQKKEYSKAENLFFSNAAENYKAISNAIIRRVKDINSEQSIKMLKALNPDVVVNLGGAVYKENFIKAFRLMLNYHSGISPIYNGAGTIDFAYANGHPHLCGGTLMIINPHIDGGDILGHYLPAIELNDTPDTLFMKNIEGAVKLYDEFLNDYEVSKSIVGIPQTESVFYYRAADWSLWDQQRVKRHIKNEICSKYLRNERKIKYWTQETRQKAESLFRNIILKLILNDEK